MKHIQELVLNDYLDSDSLKGIKIDEIKLSAYDISQSSPNKLIKISKIVSENKNTIRNSLHVLALIVQNVDQKLTELVLYQKRTDPVLEQLISLSTFYSVKHLARCKSSKVKTDFKVDEKKLIDGGDPFLIMEYIQEIKKERFIEAEETIVNSISIAIEYCADYIKKPWKELEEKIESRDTKIFYFNYIYKVIVPYYKKEFKGQNIRSLIQKNYSLYEEKIMNGHYERQNTLPVYMYSKEIIGGRWIEFEKMVEDKIKSGKEFNESDTHDFFQYMLEIYPGRWKIAEPYFIKYKKGFNDLKFVEDYINKKVIPEYKQNLNSFEDLEKYKDEFNMWDKLITTREIIFIFNPLYMYIKLRNLVNYYDKKIVQNLFKEYFPLNYKKYIEPII